jgi:stage V sporulation protein AD
MDNNIIKGEQTKILHNKPHIIGGYSIVGPKEGRGPLHDYFDYIIKDDTFGEKSFELAERKMLEQCVLGATIKAGLKVSDVDAFLAGDLLNQIISASFTARKLDTPFIGVFGACSTISLSLAVGACLVDGGYFKNVLCATSSHFATAERQFRFPLELGNQKPPTGQWTVTGAGADILSLKGKGPYISCVTFGKVVDFGISDVNNMGAAMAPAAMRTLVSHFKDTGTTPDDYDMIITGDLGKLGSEILIDLMEHEGYKLGKNYMDCGHTIFDKDQMTFMGGSGCGCSASVFNSFILTKLIKGEFKKVLFMATGALLSTTSSAQGENIPGIAHAIVVESEVK